MLRLTDWKSATADMKDLEIDNYLAEVVVAIDDLGGRVNLVGLCQGGWVSAMVAARFPDKVNALVLAGAPIDTDAGNGPIKRMAHKSPLSFYQELVALGGGLMLGKYMLAGWKNMHPQQHYVQDQIDLYEHIDDPAYLAKEETFNSWYENPIDLPGRWYLQVIDATVQGEPARQRRIRRSRPQAQSAQHHLSGLPPGRRRRRYHDARTGPRRREISRHAEGIASFRKLVPGGHIGLFMGAHTLKEHWPAIARWITAQ